MKIKLKLNDYELFKKRMDESLDSIKFTFFKSSGPGGQHRNKVETACRVVDPITGFSEEAVNSKSQKINKQNAWKKLVLRLLEHFEELDRKEGLIEIPKSTKIRSYNEKRNEVLDHRNGMKDDYKKVLDGNLEKFIPFIENKN